jgi:hypothetical protein
VTQPLLLHHSELVCSAQGASNQDRYRSREGMVRRQLDDWSRCLHTQSILREDMYPICILGGGGLATFMCCAQLKEAEATSVHACHVRPRTHDKSDFETCVACGSR